MSRHTSEDMASLAGRVLNSKTSTQIARRLAASVLSQYAPHDPRASEQRRTSEEMAQLASRVLDSSLSNAISRRLAASVLSQRGF